MVQQAFSSFFPLDDCHFPVYPYLNNNKIFLILLNIKANFKKQVVILNHSQCEQNMKSQAENSSSQQKKYQSQQQVHEIFFTAVPQRKDRKRKTNNIAKRVSELSNTSKKPKGHKQQNKRTYKSKIDRKDTSETDPNVSRNQPIKKDQSMSYMLLKSQNDPFLRRKLKNMMQSDLKSLTRLNDHKNVDVPTIESIKIVNNDHEINSIDSSLLIDKEFSRIPKDIIMILIKSQSEIGQTSTKSIHSLRTLKQRVQNDFTEHEFSAWQDYCAMNQNNTTTLRRESYLTKLNRLQSLKQVKEKEKYQQLYTPQCHLLKKQEQLWGAFQKFNIRSQK